LNEYTFFQILLIISFVVAVGAFLTLFFISAPYGRHTRRGWGPSLPNWLGWLLMESISTMVIVVMFMIGSAPRTAATITFLLMWEVHYIQRSFIYPFLLRDGQKKMPLAIPLMAMVFNLGNGYINGRYLFHFSDNRYDADWLLTQRFMIGMVLFIAGFIINRMADNTLRGLRQPGETGYKIPHGGLYRYISCPNYFGEIVEWIGWAVATWSLPGLAFAVWTFANLVPRAQANHKWYHEHFDEYPHERKALIPWVW
jgi:protein-S-isoprenylcysteine O-methyltransferase Ste14